jgi:hypothetical protein
LWSRFSAVGARRTPPLVAFFCGFQSFSIRAFCSVHAATGCDSSMRLIASPFLSHPRIIAAAPSLCACFMRLRLVASCLVRSALLQEPLLDSPDGPGISGSCEIETATYRASQGSPRRRSEFTATLTSLSVTCARLRLHGVSSYGRSRRPKPFGRDNFPLGAEAPIPRAAKLSPPSGPSFCFGLASFRRFGSGIAFAAITDSHRNRGSRLNGGEQNEDFR